MRSSSSGSWRAAAAPARWQDDLADAEEGDLFFVTWRGRASARWRIGVRRDFDDPLEDFAEYS